MRNLLLLAVIGCFLGTSCQFSPCGFSKDNFVDNHEKLVKAAKKNKKNWSKTEWESKDEQMKKMVSECYEQYEEEMSSNEIAAFWTGTGTYYFNRFGKGFIKELKRSEKDLTEALQNGLQALEDNKKGFLKGWLRENLGDDIKGALDDVKGELDRLGEELETLLEE